MMVNELTRWLVVVKRHKWTDCEIQWLRDNLKNYSWNEISNKFNNHFNTDLSQSSIEHICLRRRITHNREHEVGFIKSVHNEYSLTRDIGSERADSRGRIFIKIRNDVNNAYKNWVQKDRYIWEQTYGKLSKEDLLIHLDNDKSNCNITNLYKVNRSVNRQMATFNWFFTNPELTLTAIKCCELMTAINCL